jgi:predicted lactoylglutathione lyase
MAIGAFSLSLSVKDIHVSKDFYEKLGFEKFHGDIEQKWLIMTNGDVVIGLFEGMFDGNLMTFNPGWDSTAQDVDPFTDVRDLAKAYEDKGIQVNQAALDAPEGPGSFMIEDPDGNVILIDQHR